MAANAVRPDYPADALQRAARIRVIGFDVDGTLTDGRLLVGDDGNESKSFHVQDGLGIKLLGLAGIEVALVTARISAAVERRGRELGIARVHTHTREKLACMQAIAGKWASTWIRSRSWATTCPTSPRCARPGWRSCRRTRTTG
jgi:3-deoxy-D-manno-octulosonate 8-phosphate phosphatase (KDO 8-P phosphatase)